MSHFRELTVEQFEKLQALTEQIRGDQTKNYALGKALLEVKNLLMGTGIGFENYCKKHFNIAHAHVSRLMNYARVRDNIGMGNQNVYIPENTLRGLDRYSAEIQKQIWEEAKRLAGDQKMPNTKQVQDARKKIAPKDEQNPSDMKKQFHSRALNAQVDLEMEKPVEIIRKAENVAKIKAVIKELVQRVELMPEEQTEICEIIKAKAEAEAVALMTRKSTDTEDKETREVKAA